MLISELARATSTPIATVKFYIREGMLPRGQVSSATRSEYGPEHESRLRLIHALAEVRGLPLARVKEILALVDAPLEDDPLTMMGRAIGALPPYVDEAPDHPRARAAIEAVGFDYDPRFAAVGQLEAAIRSVEAAGLEWNPRVARRYGEAMARVASEEVAPIADLDPAEAMRYAVLGTALYEPVMLALRRLAHHDRLSRASADQAGQTSDPADPA